MPISKTTPGLHYRVTGKRGQHVRVPFWVAPPTAVEAGFIVKECNLGASDIEDIPQICHEMRAAAVECIQQYRNPYDGTIGGLMILYMTHKESPFKKLPYGTRASYMSYTERMIRDYGKLKVSRLTGTDVVRWHKEWQRVPESSEVRLAAAHMALSVLRGAVSFGALCGIKDCWSFRTMLAGLHVSYPKPRQEAPGIGEIVAAMNAAIRLGYPSAAFAYALQFETAARQADLIGRWFPFNDPTPCLVDMWTPFRNHIKWIGTTWADVDANMILKFCPTKTENTTGRRVEIDLKLCPLVMDHLEAFTPEEFKGPLIINDRTGKPFTQHQFKALWDEVRKEAGLRKTLWNRDIRAGALTEASMAGASVADRAKLGAHSPSITQRVYDRDILMSSRRVSMLRLQYRAAGNTSA